MSQHTPQQLSTMYSELSFLSPEYLEKSARTRKEDNQTKCHKFMMLRYFNSFIFRRFFILKSNGDNVYTLLLII